MNNYLIPCFRFKNFQSMWKEYKIGEIFTVTRGQVLATSQTSTIQSLENPYPVYSSQTKKNGLMGFYKSYLFDNAITWTTDGANAGTVKFREGKFFSTNVNGVLLSNNGYANIAVAEALNKVAWKYVSKVGNPKLMNNVMSEIKLRLPETIEEQNEISSFFKDLDDLIFLHEQELDVLKKTKQGFLQKMFPKNEATIPEIRFPEFRGDWRLTTLGEIAEIVRGASPRPIQNPKWFDDISEVGWLRISDVTEQNGRIHRLEQRLSVDGQSKTRVLTKPHLMLSIAATVGKPVINYVSTGVHDGFLIFKNPQFDIEFMFQWLEMFRLKWSKYGQPGSQVNLNSELVRNQILYLPDIKEQIKIGKFFRQLDEVIDLKEEELEALKKTKQGFLQKMFV